MKLADLKRIKVGTRVNLIASLLGPSDIPRWRTVKKVHSNSIEFSPDGSMTSRSSWLYFPKAKNFRDDGDGFTILEEGEVAAQYVFDGGE